MSAFAGPFPGPIVRVLEFWPFPGENANIGASVGLPRRSLPTFFGLGKKVGRGLGLKTPIVFETALLSAGLLKKSNETQTLSYAYIIAGVIIWEI
ncbi:hypothetical protein CHISP_3598 [Chitinispirillum alkaliphilum]|nr:hypothetical protein CHISP_3598 [Chitinispirillum alkaliphilum]